MPWQHPFPQDNRGFEQGLRPRQQECNGHLKMWLRVSAIVYQLLWVIWLKKSLLTILESNWYERFEDGKKKDEILSPTQQQNRSFHVVDIDWTRTAAKCTKMKNARTQHAKDAHAMQSMQKYCFIANYANLRCSCRHRHRCCLNSVMLDI